MSSNVVNQVPYLRTSRNFPEEQQPLVVEINRSYVDTAAKVNERVIGIYSANRPAITGEGWFFTNQKRDSLRQIYTFTGTSNIPHGINVSGIYQFSPACKGVYTDGTNWYGLPFGTSVAVAGLITFYITPTNIVFNVGAGAPALSSGTIDLEWISNTGTGMTIS
jgi:hypothetical protein